MSTTPSHTDDPARRSERDFEDYLQACADEDRESGYGCVEAWNDAV
jgi:hypothetical protein